MSDTIFTYNSRIPVLNGRVPYRPAAGDADALAFLSATGITDPTITTAINDLVVGLKTNSLWTKMAAVYPFVGGTATTHKFNLKDPRDLDAAHRIIWSGTVTHNSNGITGNGTNGYGNTNLIPSTSMTNNNTHVSYYSRTNSLANSIEIGVSMPVSRIVMHTRWGDGNLYSDAYEFTNSRVTVANSNSTGFYIQSRILSTDHKVFKNGTQFGTTNTTTTTGNTNDITNPLFILARRVNTGGPGADFSARNLAFVSIGSGLSTSDASNLTTLVNSFQQTLGRDI